MSYDLGLVHPVTGEALELDAPHRMKGGTYCVDGSDTADINITYNYWPHFRRVLGGKGIRELYGKTGGETIPILKAAIEALDTDVSDDYWEATEGNARAALCQCLALAQMRPDGIWQGD